MTPAYTVHKRDEAYYFQAGVNCFRKGLTKDLADDLPVQYRAAFRRGWDIAASNPSPALIEMFKAMKIT